MDNKIIHKNEYYWFDFPITRFWVRTQVNLTNFSGGKIGL